MNPGRSCSPEGASFFEHSKQRDWTLRGPSSSVDGTFPKAIRRTVEAPDPTEGSRYAGGGIGDEKQPTLTSPPRCRIATVERWARYMGPKIPMILEAMPTMVKPMCSNKGTFSVNKDRGAFFTRGTKTPGPKYDAKEGLYEAAMHRNTSFFKNTSSFRSNAPRFTPLQDPEDAPGPIYFPKSDFGSKSVSIPADDRFHYKREFRRVPGPGAYSPNVFKVPLKKNLVAPCHFGQRLDQDVTSASPGPAHYTAASPKKGPQFAFATKPYSDSGSVRSKSPTMKPKQSVPATAPSGGPTTREGRVLPTDKYESDSSIHAFSVVPRFPKPVVDGRDYNITKFTPKNLPSCPTFSHENHDKTFIRMMPCKDSPGPCEYTVDKLQTRTNYNRPVEGAKNRWR